MRVSDNNAGRQVAGGAVVRPTAAMVFGVSASRGAWLNETLETEVAGAHTDRAQQVALGGDAEFSAGRFLVRGEAIRAKRFNLGRYDVTDVEGRFELPSLPSGAYTVVGSSEGDARVTRSMLVPPGGWAEVDLVVP